MANKSSVVEVTLDSTLANVETAEEIARSVSTAAGFGEDDQHRIQMAVHESMINAIWHGNKNDPRKRVWLQFRIFIDRLEIHVRDQGSGFDLASIPDPLAHENLLKVSGRGIFLIRSFMDEFRVERIPGTGTEVVLVKRLNCRNLPTEGGTDREHEGNSAPG